MQIPDSRFPFPVLQQPGTRRQQASIVNVWTGIMS